MKNANDTELNFNKLNIILEFSYVNDTRVKNEENTFYKSHKLKIIKTQQNRYIY